MKSWRLIIPTIALIVGMALPSATSYAAVPAPSAPTNVMAWAGNQSARVTWESPVIALSYALTQYRINVYHDGLLARTVDFSQPASEKVITGLLNYHAYTFTLQLKQSTVGANVEESAWSVSSPFSNPVVPPGGSLPGAPPTLDAHGGSAAALITWGTPASVSQLTTYQVTAYQLGPSGFYVVQRLRTASASPTVAWINTLENGQSYRFTVQAANTAGWGPESVVTTPAISPSSTLIAAPTITSISAGNGSITVAWAGPYTTGIDHYLVLVTRDDGTLVAYRDRMPPPLTITGLTNGLAYNVDVRAVTAQHMLSLAAQSRIVPPSPIRPAAVTGVQAVAGNGMATVSWLPAFDGGSPITSYIVAFSANPNDVAAIVHPTTDGSMLTGGRWNATINGLANGRTYTFYVYAINAMGTSQPAVSTSITLATVPGAPRNLVVTPVDSSLSVKWDAPSSDGGFPIQSYQVTASDGVHPVVVATVAGTSATLIGLSNGFTYTVTVTAANAIGIGSPASALAIPRNLAPSITVPSAMTVDFGDVVNATVTASGPEATDHLALSASGLPNGVTFTDKGNGTGIVAGNADVPAGTYTMSFVVNDGHNASVSQNMTLTVVRERAEVRLFPTAPLSVAVKSNQTEARSLTIRATIREATDPNGNADIGEAADVTNTLTSVHNGGTYSGKAITAGHGIGATMTAKYTFHNVPRGIYELRISIGGNYYTGTAEAMVTVSSPSILGGVTGNGLVQVPANNASAQFQLKGQRRANGRLAGNLLYVEQHGADVYTFRSTSITALVFKGHTAYVQGKGTLNGVGNYQFVATVVDQHHQGSIDRFGLRVIDGSFATVNHCTFAPVDLTSGQATILHG